MSGILCSDPEEMVYQKLNPLWDKMLIYSCD